jgi:DNA/RNA-binding domain of Phe-tRNA-synthetase-like protein
MKIEISKKISQVCPQIQLGIIQCEVKNSASNSELWKEIDQEIGSIFTKLTLEEINKRPEIEATRKIYKKLGKDPNRYRPSAEALCRRILREIPIYKVNTLVDIINLVSIRSGFSIGGFDFSKIERNILLDIGNEQDEFEAIGRGLMNVSGLPIFRDEIGGIGTPTSDNERTKITSDTKQLLLVINNYSDNNAIQKAIDHALNLLEKYASMKFSQFEIIKSTL